MAVLNSMRLNTPRQEVHVTLSVLTVLTELVLHNHLDTFLFPVLNSLHQREGLADGCRQDPDVCRLEWLTCVTTPEGAAEVSQRQQQQQQCCSVSYIETHLLLPRAYKETVMAAAGASVAAET